MLSLTAADVEYARVHLNETPERRVAALALLHAWAVETPELNVKPDDDLFTAFLRTCKYDVEQAKKKIAAYQTLRRDVPEWFTNRDPLSPAIAELVRLGVFVPLKLPDRQQRLVVIIRTAVHDPRRHAQDDVLKAGKMVLDIAAHANKHAQIYGVTAIFDMAGVTAAHGRQMTPSIIRRAVRAWSDYHCSPKRLQFVNAPIYIEVVLRIFRRFMSEKMRQRIGVCKDCTELHKVMAQHILPTEYGGEAGSILDLADYWYKRLMDCRDWFIEDEAYKAL